MNKENKIPILGFLPEEIADKIEAPKYRAEQIFRWLHQRKVKNFEEMKNLPSELQKELSNRFDITNLKAVSHKEADDSSIKWLLETPSQDAIECVLIPTKHRKTLCISTQVGCKFGCKFCASGVAGFKRNLNVDEIVAEVYAIERDLHCRDGVTPPLQPAREPENPVTHIVVMGMGEPFDNDQNLIKALQILNHPWGRALGKRRITISTVGLPKKILAFAKLKLPFELSVSLHSAIDEVRSSIMPVNRAFPLKQLFEACWAYTQESNRVITFEFILIDGVNCDDRNAETLVRALKKRKAKVNLIPYNPIDEFPKKRPSLDAIRRFEKKLKQARIPVTVRFSKGGSVNGACGQLRLRKISSQNA